MIDESIMEKIIPLPDEDEEMEKVQGELEGEGFPITNFKKGGIFYHLCRMLVTIYIELKELARTIVNGCFIKHAEGDWLKIKAADYSKQQKEAKAARGYVSIYRSEYNNALQVTKGHCFKTEPDAGGNELKFYCCENTVIDAGEPVGRVLVEAEATGTYYNIAPGRITISMIHLDGVDYVTNDDDWLFEEGAEEEDLEDLRDRCMSSWAELATRTIEEKLRNAAKAVPGVLDARIDAQHPRGQGTVDVIVTGAAGEASPELIRKVGEAIEPLKGNYEDYLVKSSEVVRQDFELVIYLAEDAATDGVDAQATKLIEDMMALTRGEMNTLYRDSIIQVLSTKIDKLGVRRCYERDIGQHMWSPSTVMGILYNEVYIGSVINNKTADNIDTGHQVVQRYKEDWIIVENCHEPLVSVEDFKLAHKMIARREKSPRKPNGKWRKSYLRCGVCGKGLNKYGNGSSYRCREGHVSRIRGEEIEQAVLDVARKMAVVRLEEFEIQMNKDSSSDDIGQEIESLKKAKAHYAKLKFEIYDDYTRTNITREQMAKKTAEVKNKIAELDKMIAEKQELFDLQKDLFVDAKQEQLTKLSKLDKFDEDVIRNIIDYVLIYDNEHIEIKWNFDDFHIE